MKLIKRYSISLGGTLRISEYNFSRKLKFYRALLSNPILTNGIDRHRLAQEVGIRINTPAGVLAALRLLQRIKEERQTVVLLVLLGVHRRLGDPRVRPVKNNVTICRGKTRRMSILNDNNVKGSITINVNDIPRG